MKKKSMSYDEAVASFCNPTYERMLLSAGLNDSDRFYTLLSSIAEDDFLAEDNKAIYTLLKIMHGRDVRVFELSMIAAFAKDMGLYEKIGGYEYLQALHKMPVDATNFDMALRGVLDASTKFKLYISLSGHLANLLESSGISSEKPASDHIGEVQSSVLDLSVGSKSVVEPVHVASGLLEYIEDRRNKPVNIVGIPTGYPVLDSQIDGQIAGTLLVIAARKKQGKSALLTNIALNVGINENTPVLYVDTEMTFPEWRTRVLAAVSGVDERKIKHGDYSDAVFDKLCKAEVVLNKCGVYHHYLPGYNLDKITALYKKYRIKQNIGLGIFDYIKEPESSSIDRQRKEYQILGDVATRLKDLAGELNIPFTTAVQLNRDGDIADSDRIARYADVTAFWGQRDEKTLKDHALDGELHGFYGLTIKDSRRGGATISPGISFQFLRSILKIVEVPRERQVVPLLTMEERRED